MAGRRGRPPRSEDQDGYLAWRAAEERVARLSEPWTGRPDDVAGSMPADPVTVARWRRTIPSVRVWRAWLHEAFDKYDGMAEVIDRGDFDLIRGPVPTTRTHGAYLAEIVAILARIKSRPEIARLLGVSPRTVRRYRT